jgi:hypothetical protein
LRAAAMATASLARGKIFLVRQEDRVGCSMPVLTSMGRSFPARRLYRVQNAPASFTAMFKFSENGTGFARIMV